MNHSPNNSGWLRWANNHYWPYAAGYAIFLSLGLLRYYWGGSVVMGGEGAFFLDFTVFWENVPYTAWFPFNFLGMPALSPGANFFNVLTWYAIERLFLSEQATSFAVTFFLFFGHFLAMFLVGRLLGVRPALSFLAAAFYALNPFILNHTGKLNQWLNPAMILPPLYFYLLYRFHRRYLLLFWWWGVLSVVFSFANANPPMLAATQLTVISSVLVTVYLREGRLDLKIALKMFAAALAAYLLFNMWWLLPTVKGISYGLQIYRPEFAHWYLQTTVNPYNVLEWMLSFTTNILFSIDDIFTHIHQTVAAQVVTLIPLFLVLWGVFFIPGRRSKRLLSLLLAVTCAYMFLAKGTAPPFGEVYLFLFKNVPLFNIFKTPIEKFGVLFIFYFSLLLLFVLDHVTGTKPAKLFYGALTGYLLFCAIPVFVGQILPDGTFFKSGVVTKRFFDWLEYKEVRRLINLDKQHQRVMRMPGLDYPIFWNHNDDPLWGHTKRLYSGIGPVVNNTNKIILTPRDRLPGLYYHFDDPRFVRYLWIYNVGSLFFYRSMVFEYAVPERQTDTQLEEIYDRTFKRKRKWDLVSLYWVDDFQPRITPMKKAHWLPIAPAP